MIRSIPNKVKLASTVRNIYESSDLCFDKSTQCLSPNLKPLRHFAVPKAVKNFIPGTSIMINKASGINQVRHLAKRKLAYPEAYRPVVPPQNGKKDHSSYFQRAFKAWLGPKNIRGEYYRNRYYYPPQDHKPNYIVQDGKTVVDDSGDQVVSRRFEYSKRDPSVHPFPDNIHCKTNVAISHEMKSQIFDDATVKNMTSQKIAHKYGIKLARVDAIVRLYKIEQSFKPSVCIRNSRIDDEIILRLVFKTR